MLQYWKFILLNISLFSKNTAGSSPCRTSFSKADHILPGHVIRTLNYKNFESCTFSCELEPQCFSVNYISLHKTCQLNNATKKYFHGDLVKQKGAVYIDMVIRSYNPCEGMRCKNGGICVISLQCRCPKELSGRHCETCNQSLPLGMEDGSVPDNNITASSTHTHSRTAWGRLHCSLGSWTPNTDGGYQWLQVNFVPKVKLITRIATQGRGGSWPWWVKSYYVMYKAGDAHLQEYSENNRRVTFQGNTYKDDVVTNEITNPFQADAVRIIPITFLGRIALRIELYGCDI